MDEILWMPPTAIQRYIDGRWGFKTSVWIPEPYSDSTIIFSVDTSGMLVESQSEYGLPPQYGNSNSHDLARAVYFEIPEVRVRFV